MRKLIPLLFLLAPLAVGQEATLSSPVSRSSEAKYVINFFQIVRSPLIANINVSVQDSSNNEIRTFNVTVPGGTCPNATVGGLGTAMITVRATETGADLRKLNFRVLGYLSDQSCISGVTLAP